MQAPPIPARGDAASAGTPLDGVTLKDYAAPLRVWRLE
jgi:hypothetical protein